MTRLEEIKGALEFDERVQGKWHTKGWREAMAQAILEEELDELEQEHPGEATAAKAEFIRDSLKEEGKVL